MGKFKPSKPKSATAAAPQMKAGMPCIVIVIVVIILVMFLMYEAMKNAS